MRKLGTMIQIRILHPFAAMSAPPLPYLAPHPFAGRRPMTCMPKIKQGPPLTVSPVGNIIRLSAIAYFFFFFSAFFVNPPSKKHLMPLYAPQPPISRMFTRPAEN